MTRIHGSFSLHALDTCDLVHKDSPCKVLGGWVGTAEQITTTFEASLPDLHEAIESVEDPASCFVHKATCASVGKLMFSMCLVGDLISPGALNQADELLRASLSTTIGDDLVGDVWEQAQCRLAEGRHPSRTYAYDIMSWSSRR